VSGTPQVPRHLAAPAAESMASRCDEAEREVCLPDDHGEYLRIYDELKEICSSPELRAHVIAACDGDL